MVYHFIGIQQKKQLGKVMRESKPDLVHAHNIFSAKIISEFDIPFVFDDHEYTSVYVRGLTEGVENISRSIDSATGNCALSFQLLYR